MKKWRIFKKVKDEIKIKLSTPEDITDFIGTVTAFHDDVDLIDGSNIIDAKSLVGVCSLDRNKILTVRLLSNNAEAIEEFSQFMERFKVK